MCDTLFGSIRAKLAQIRNFDITNILLNEPAILLFPAFFGLFYPCLAKRSNFVNFPGILKCDTIFGNHLTWFRRHIVFDGQKFRKR